MIFLVDRIALTNQTADAYRAYDPVAGFEGKTGVVSDTANISDLHRKLTIKSDKNIIVTSIQKMSRYVSRQSFKPLMIISYLLLMKHIDLQEMEAKIKGCLKQLEKNT